MQAAAAAAETFLELITEINNHTKKSSTLLRETVAEGAVGVSAGVEGGAVGQQIELMKFNF